MMYETIQYTVQNGVATLELSRPDKLNAFNSQMIHEIKAAVKEASKDEQVRCIVFTGAGRAFCSGQDLAEVDENMDHGQVLREHYGPMMKQIHELVKNQLWQLLMVLLQGQDLVLHLRVIFD